MIELFFILSHFFLIYLIFSLNVLDNINNFRSLYEYSFAENISVNIPIGVIKSIDKKIKSKKTANILLLAKPQAIDWVEILKIEI